MKCPKCPMRTSGSLLFSTFPGTALPPSRPLSFFQARTRHGPGPVKTSKSFRVFFNSINYVTGVKVPTLMLNGRYDMTFPFELTVKPMFDLLGTPAADKRLILYDTDHIVPLTEYIKETLAWLDKYLGPVKR